MLNIREVTYHSPFTESTAPDVYIHLTEVDDNFITVFYSIEDDLNNWIVNNIVLENLYLYVHCNNQVYKQSLSYIKKNNTIIDGKVFGSIKFDINDSDIELTAYCGNDNLKGIEVTEKVLSMNSVTTSSYESQSYSYINKNKDLRLLQIPAENFVFQKNITNNTHRNSYISKTTNKQNVFGFIVDLEEILNNYSSLYYIFKNSNAFRENILNNSSIVQDSIKFYKKNITS